MPGTRTSFEDHDCGFAQAVEAIGDQWCMLILRNIGMGMTRFDDFVEHLSISPKVLTDRLKRLQDRGLVAAEPDPADGRGKIYQLSDSGHDLAPIVAAISLWGEKWIPKKGGPRTEFYDTQTGEPVKGIAVLAKSGRALAPARIGHRTGPGGSKVRDELDAIVARREA